jgi:hypothetical protein
VRGLETGTINPVIASIFCVAICLFITLAGDLHNQGDKAALFHRERSLFPKGKAEKAHWRGSCTMSSRFIGRSSSCPDY